MKPEIRSTSGNTRELAAAAQLEGLLETYDTRRWLFTDLVRIQSMAVPRSHPVLRLSTRHLGNDLRALQTYLHEQLHWWLLDLPGASAALDEVRARWPEPPSRSQGGAANPFSSWLHLVLCPLEIQAAEEVAGQFTLPDVYTWVYRQILDDRPWFDDLVERHQLAPPTSPSEPIRWPVGLECHGVRFYSTGDDPLLAQLSDVHARHPDLLVGEQEVVVDSNRSSTFHPGLQIGGENAGDTDALSVSYAFAQAVVLLGGRPQPVADDSLPAHLMALVTDDPFGASTLLAGGLALPRLDEAALASLARTPLGARLSPLLPHLAELEQLTAGLGLP